LAASSTAAERHSPRHDHRYAFDAARADEPKQSHACNKTGLFAGGAIFYLGEVFMTDLAAHIPVGTSAPVRPKLEGPSNVVSVIAFFGIVGAALLFIAYSLYADVDSSGTQTTTFLPYLLLFIALLIALGFEFVNGFHDTANAVATVIYTHTLPAHAAVVWSGFFNFLGVVLSSGAVAFSIVSLLPVELILQVGSAAGFAMVLKDLSKIPLNFSGGNG